MSSNHLMTHLRHVDIAMPELGDTLSFYRDLWGPKETESYSGINFLAAAGSPEPYIVRLRNDPMRRLDLVAFVHGPDTLAELNVVDQWGTANAMTEFVASRPFNDVDQGLFVAPPV